MIPKPGQCLAIYSHGFVEDSIKLLEGIKELRNKTFSKGEILVNHIATIANNKNGKLCVYDMTAKGCVETIWEESRYFRNEVKYFILELTKEPTPYELLGFQIAIRNDVGKPYDFGGIVSQLIFSLFGKWFGKKGKAAKERFYCSEQWTTRWNEQIPGIFRFPWLWSPQLVFESVYVKIVGSNFETR